MKIAYNGRNKSVHLEDYEILTYTVKTFILAGLKFGSFEI